MHSQICYKEMRNKLVCLVKPIPAEAIQADELEKFRAMLYQQPAVWEPMPAAMWEPVHIVWCSAAWDLCEDELSIPTTKEVSVAPLVTEVSALRAAPSATDKTSNVSEHVVMR